MASENRLPTALASVYLTGSLLSLVGTGFILLCYLLLPMKRHFRHVLIINLMTSGFLHALNTSLSGFWIVVRGQGLQEGSLCVANGFIGQLSGRGVDCTVLAIALVTVYTITRHNTMGPVNAIWDWSTIFRVTFAIWMMPIITSCIALGMKWYSPASGTWCFIVDDPRYLRYLLTYGWRFLFISINIGLYIYLVRRGAEFCDRQLILTTI
ncbi:glucose receptor Git3 [Crucibulum laeve]|uniref:Glucose receptor Git3 n=1 Tax=Crucibulum laeve TaxID=68775 RepID=A0A5C3LIM7_9AGAR|nr:glucose receptor Git3 [Crucibulum laeve]